MHSLTLEIPQEASIMKVSFVRTAQKLPAGQLSQGVNPAGL